MQAKHLKGTISFCAALIVGVALVAASGAGAAKAPRMAQIDVSTKAGVVHYLRSIHVNPKGVVIQRGLRNYAGPNCPGKRWTCASTARTVVQVAPRGGKNTFACTTASCAVVQVAAAPTAKPNKAMCIKTTGVSGTCSITQSSATANNDAIVVQGQVNGAKISGLTQTASYAATIKQTATGGESAANNNTLCLLQSVNMEGNTQAKKGTPVLVTFNAQQTAAIDQDSLYGSNVLKNASFDVPTGTWKCDADGSRLTQSQRLSSNANGTTKIEQYENATSIAPNIQLDVRQNQNQTTPANSVGQNHASFAQSINQTAVAGGSQSDSVIQKQATDEGGIQATVNQFAHGISTADALQTETQCEHAQLASITATTPCVTATPPLGLASRLTQEQHGPLRKGGGPSGQGDNAADTFVVTQSSTQDNDLRTNQSNIVQGDYLSSGNCGSSSCKVDQTATVNGKPTNTSANGSDVDAQTTCSGTSCEVTCTGFCISSSGAQTSLLNADVAESGFGGMRGTGTGSIAVSGIPSGSSILKAFLYWNGPTNSADPDSNKTVTFSGTSVTGTNIGTASSNCWPFSNSQSYRADVTSLVTGDGSYSLADFVKAGGIDVNGVALLVFYADGNSSNDRNVALWNGNDSNFAQSPDPAGWDETIDNVPYPGSGSASLDFVVSDGQTADDPQLLINGVELAPAGPNFSGATLGGGFDANGSLWDVKSFDLTPFLTGSSNDLHLTTGVDPVGTVDCTSLVVAAANTPASAPVILAPMTSAHNARADAAASGSVSARPIHSSGELAGTTAAR